GCRLGPQFKKAIRQSKSIAKRSIGPQLNLAATQRDPCVGLGRPIHDQFCVQVEPKLPRAWWLPAKRTADGSKRAHERTEFSFDTPPGHKFGEFERTDPFPANLLQINELLQSLFPCGTPTFYRRQP